MGTNYVKRFGMNKQVETKKTDIIEEKPVIKELTGVVGNCMRLNVRKEPDKSSDVLYILSENSEVTIYPEESDEVFYKVKTDKNVYGYCMKEFITIK